MMPEMDGSSSSRSCASGELALHPILVITAKDVTPEERSGSKEGGPDPPEGSCGREEL
jgi:hypothetical protein